VTAHSKNVRIDKKLQGGVSRWGKEANVKLGVARMDMADAHTTLESVMPLILEFPRALQMTHLTSRDEMFCWGGTQGDLHELDS
jgi:hypothetical protein